MTQRARCIRVSAAAFVVFIMTGLPATAQVTTGSITGTVKDAQGGVVPGATVTLKSETKGTTLTPVVTDSSGNFALPVTPVDTYTVEISMDSFKTVQQSNVAVSPGSRVSLGVITLEVGGTAETVVVKAENSADPGGERRAVVQRPDRIGSEPAVCQPRLHDPGVARAGRHRHHGAGHAELHVHERRHGWRLDDGHRAAAARQSSTSTRSRSPK